MIESVFGSEKSISENNSFQEGMNSPSLKCRKIKYDSSNVRKKQIMS